MSSFYADFLITQVHFTGNETHHHKIDYVKVLKWNSGIYISVDALVKVSDVIKNIEQNNVSYHTATLPDGFVTDGAKVIVEKKDSAKFITTVPNGKKEDNLDNLPKILVVFPSLYNS